MRLINDEPDKSAYSIERIGYEEGCAALRFTGLSGIHVSLSAGALHAFFNGSPPALDRNGASGGTGDTIKSRWNAKAAGRNSPCRCVCECHYQCGPVAEYAARKNTGCNEPHRQHRRPD